MKHLTPDERMALIEQADPPRHPHLAECESCGRDIAAMRSLLADVRQVDVLEPSPLFWEHFSARVSGAVGEAGRPAVTRWSPTGAWRIWVPLAAGVSALVLVAALTMPRSPVRAQTAVVPAPALSGAMAGADQAEADAAAEGQWLALTHLADGFDLEAVSESGAALSPGSADTAVWQLSEQERVELDRLLRAELRP
ncbi:MAG TPA: hypothetical protein VGK32_07260 [Vicinamibacterales bacterium]|jgi:hypothetical protein